VAGKTSWKWLADESGEKEKRMKEAEGKPSTPIFLLSLLSLSIPAT